ATSAAATASSISPRGWQPTGAETSTSPSEETTASRNSSVVRSDIAQGNRNMHVSQMRVRNALAAAVMSALVVGATGQAHAADRFVSTAGSDAANDCLSSASPCRTVGYALTQAASGDTVKVAGGTYRENVTVNTATTLTLSGGWAADFSAQDSVATGTVLEPTLGSHIPVVTILASGITIAFTADGLTIKRGRNIPEVFTGAPCE